MTLDGGVILTTGHKKQYTGAKHLARFCWGFQGKADGILMS